MPLAARPAFVLSHLFFVGGRAGRRANPSNIERLLLDPAAQDGKRVRIGFGQDPGQAGKSQAQHLVRMLSAFTVDPAVESGDKLTRFGPFSSQCRAGNVEIRRGSWNEELFRVLEGFPDLAHDDEVDACSGAWKMLNPPMTNWGLFELMRQQAEETLAAQQRKPQGAPANPAPGSMEWVALQEAAPPPARQQRLLCGEHKVRLQFPPAYDNRCGGCRAAAPFSLRYPSRAPRVRYSRRGLHQRRRKSVFPEPEGQGRSGDAAPLISTFMGFVLT